MHSNKGNSTGLAGRLSYSYTDAGYASTVETFEQYVWRTTNDKDHFFFVTTSHVPVAGREVFVIEGNEDLSSNNNKIAVQLQGGIRHAEYYEKSGSGNLTLDRSYYNVVVTNASGNIILPEVGTAAETLPTSLSASRVGVGQEYVITNLSGSTITIAAFTASGNNDYLNGVSGGTLSLAANKSVIVKSVHLSAGNGHWFTYPSN